MPPEIQSRAFFAWPNTRYLLAEEASLLEERGVNFRDYFVKAYSVPYVIYDKMEKIEAPEVIDIRLTRALLDVCKIVSSGKLVTGVSLAWDTSERPDFEVPKTLGDTQALASFARKSGNFLVFRRKGEKFDIKLRPFAAGAVLKRLPELQELPFDCSDIRQFVTDEADRKGRKPREVVFDSSRQHLAKVGQQTSEAVEKLVGDPQLVLELRESFQDTSAKYLEVAPHS